MPITRIDLDKTLRDKVTADLGLTDYYGTPEHFNSDAILPVYCIGRAQPPAEKVIAQHTNWLRDVDISGTQYYKCPIWYKMGGGFAANYSVFNNTTTSLYPPDPVNKPYYLRINMIHWEIVLDAAGRAAIAAGAVPAIAIEIAKAEEIEPAFVLASWRHDVQALAGQVLVVRGATSDSYLSSQTNRYNMHCTKASAISELNLHPEASLTSGLYPLVIQAYRLDLANWPANTLFHVHGMAEVRQYAG